MSYKSDKRRADESKGPPSIRQVHEAAMKLGPARTDAIVGAGGLSGATAAALRRLIREAERE